MDERSTGHEPDVTPRRGPGRPRKWADDAERARAYRQRKASEHAAVDELRRDRRNLRRQVVRLTPALDSERRGRALAEHRADQLASRLAEVDAERRVLRADVRRLRTLLLAAQEIRQEAAADPVVSVPTNPAPNRAARRRATKARRSPR